MNRSKAGKWYCRAVWAGLVVVASIGCNPLNTIAFMFAKDEKVLARYPLVFAKDGPKKDKDEVVVLLLPHVAPGTAPTFFNTERELVAELARIMPDMAKENKNKLKLKILSPALVDKFKTANPNWRKLNAMEVGQKLSADFVLEIELKGLQLYQPNTGQEKIFEGRGEVTVNIYEIDAEGGTFKDSYPISFAHPRDRIVRSSLSMSESEFKKQYIEGLAQEIAQRHVDHRPSNSFGR